MKIKILCFFAALSFVLMGCQQASMPSKQGIGAVLGGGAGAIAGSQVGKGKGRDVAMVVGTLLGAALGGAIGNTMDQMDVVQTQRSLEGTQTGQSVSWTNPDSEAQYTVTPTRTFQNIQGQNCRDYTTIAMIDGKREELRGTACRQPDGSWKAAN